MAKVYKFETISEHGSIGSVAVEASNEQEARVKAEKDIAREVSMFGTKMRLGKVYSVSDSFDVDNAHSKWTTDDNEPLKQKVEATLERTGLRSAVNAIYGKYPSKIGLDIDPSKSTEIVSVLKKDFSKVIYNSDTFEVVIGDALGFTSVEVPKKVAEELMLGWDIDRLCKDFHLNATKQSSSYYFVGESSWIDKFYKAYGLDQFGIRIKDSAPVADSKIEYVFNWRDTYHKTQQKTAILANNIGEAIRKFADYVALAGVGTAYAYVMSISPNDGWVALYGTAHELKKKMGDSMPVTDKLVEIPQAILNRIESIAASRGYKVAAKGETLFGRKHYEFTPLNPVTDSQMRAFVDEVDSYARSKNVPATFSANVAKVVFDFDKMYVKDSAVTDEVPYDTISVADKNWEVGKRVRMYGEYWIVINFSRGDWILESEKTKEQIRVSDSTTTFGMEDDIVKSGSGYTNKGKEGTHGQFATKKEAAAQTRAMYANGYKGDATEKEFKIYVKGPFGSYKVAEWSAVSKEAAVKEFLEMNPTYKNKGIIEARDAATVYAPIVDAGEDVKVGQQYQNARLATLTVTNITNSGNVEWQFSRDGDVYGAPVSGFKAMLEKNGYRRIKDSTKMFKVVDKATGKTLLVKATDSLAAVKRVSSLKDMAYTVTACTNDFPYGNNVAVIVDANSEDEAVAKYRKVLETRGDKINHISATPTTSSDIAKGISRFKN